LFTFNPMVIGATEEEVRRKERLFEDVGVGLLEAGLAKVSSSLGIDVSKFDHDAPIPRLAVWHTWADTESVGWVRYALDHEKIPYAYIRDEEIKAGGLRDKYDIVLYGNVYLSLKDQINGIEPRYGPMPYTKTAAYPSHGVPDASDDITGGIGGARRTLSRIAGLQLADWSLPLCADPLLSRGHLGTGYVQLAEIAAAAYGPGGYRGATEVEIFRQDVWDAPARDTARRVYESLAEICERARAPVTIR